MAFPRAVLGCFWSAQVAQSPTCTLNMPPLGNIREGPECASRGGTLGVPQGKRGSFPGSSTEGSISALLGVLLEHPGQEGPHLLQPGLWFERGHFFLGLPKKKLV